MFDTIQPDRSTMAPSRLLALCILSAATAASGQTLQQATPNFKNLTAIQDVISGRVEEANAAWWGVDPIDATTAVQGAINSGARKVIIPYTGNEWIVRPIFLAANQEIFFEPGVVVTAKEGFFQGVNDSLFAAREVANVTLRGYGAILRMRRADYASPEYPRSEWRHVVSLQGASQVVIQGLTLQSAGGDGIYVGPTGDSRRLPSRDITIEDCTCNDNLRQGVGVVSAANVRIENCTFRSTTGVPPQAGVSVEPGDPLDQIVNVLVTDCLAVQNEGTGFTANMTALGQDSVPVSLQFVRCRVLNSRQAGLRALLKGNTRPTGKVEFVGCTSEGTDYAGALVLWNVAAPLQLEFRDCKWRYVSRRSTQAPIDVQVLGEMNAEASPTILFQNGYVYDDQPREPWRVSGETEAVRFVQMFQNGVFRPVEIDGPDRPTSDEMLRCIVNLNGYATDYMYREWYRVPLITDFTVHLGSTPNDVQRYEQVRSLAASSNPGLWIGRYISGGRVQDTFKRYPAESVHASKIPAAWLRPNSDRVNLSIHEAADVFAREIVKEFNSQWAPVLFLDNIIHPSAMRGWSSWKDTCRFLKQIRSGVNAAGGILIPNVAVASWVMSDEDIALAADAADGFAFEMPFHQTARLSPEAVRRQIGVYRNWLDAGKIIVFIPVLQEGANAEQEIAFIAGFAMMVRRSGDSVFVATPFWSAAPAWQNWPAELGSARSDYQLREDSLIIERTFSTGTVRLDIPAGTARLID